MADSNRSQLDRYYKLLHSQSVDSVSIDDYPPIMQTIARHLRQFRINTIYEPLDVVNEGYIRILRKIEVGDEITNLPGLFMAIAFNIIREWSRREQRQLDIQSSYEFNADVYAKDSGAEMLDRYDALRKLEPAERYLLISHASGKSWKEIAQELIDCGDEEDSVETVANKLAQRSSRLTRLLRRDCQ